jgi:hypothetical protein
VSKWFENQRHAFVWEMLHIYGYINREHLMLKFGISQPQASKDLQACLRGSAGSMVYNASTKRYERP